MKEHTNGTSCVAPHYIREWRKFKKLTIYELGARADMSGSMVAQIERSHSRYTQRTLCQLAKGLGVEPWRLIAYPPAMEARFIKTLGQTDYWQGVPMTLRPVADEVYEVFATALPSLAIEIAKKTATTTSKKK